MFDWFRKPVPRILNIEVYDENKKLKADLEQLQEKYQQILEMVNSELVTSSVSFDFNAVNVFAVERNINNGRPCTIIGYLLPEPSVTEEGGIVTKDVVREWYIYTNTQNHEKLVEAFNASKKGKKYD